MHATKFGCTLMHATKLHIIKESNYFGVLNEAFFCTYSVEIMRELLCGSFVSNP